MHLNRTASMFYKFLIPVVKEQKKRGHYVCLCTTNDPVIKLMRDKNLDVFTYGTKKKLTPYYIIKTVFKIRKILSDLKIDVLICHSPVGAGIGRLTAWITRTPIVIYFAHGLPCNKGQNPFTWLLWFSIEKSLGLLTDAMVVMNDYDENLALNSLIKKPNKIFRIPGMGVDLTKFNCANSRNTKKYVCEELGLSKDQKVILCISMMIPSKGIFIFLEAARQICANRNNVCFLLAGKGPMTDKLNELSKEYGLESQFRILGWRNDVDQLMQAADIFVLPSYYFEGLPVSLLEAMACQKPVISTLNKGCEDAVIDKKTGFLIPTRQVDPLLDKISILLDSPQLCKEMGQAGRKHVERFFELECCTKKITDVLEIACKSS